MAFLTMMPVYLVYRTYSTFIGRLDDERRHVEETRRLHGEAVAALLQARQSEQALADENERLGVMLRSIGDGVIASDLDGSGAADQQRRGSAHRLAPGRGARAAARLRCFRTSIPTRGSGA